MKLFIQKKQNGVGLIEVLIATVVIAIGLLAVASLQGEFISSSGDNKIRSEALALAEQKIEEFRNNIKRGTLADSSVAECTGANANIDGYLGICPPVVSNTAPVYPEVITGSNTSFTRTWVVSAGGSGDRKKISVTVSWDNNGDVNTINDDEKINVVTEMTFIDPAKSALYAVASGTGTGAVPSPRQNASEDVNAASENVVGTDRLILNGGDAGTDDELTLDVPIEENGSLIIYQVAPNSHFYTSTTATGVDPGVIAVFLCNDANGTGTCSHIQNHFGGVVHRVKGTVYSTSGNDLSSVLVAWTSSDVHACYVGSVSEYDGTGESMPYECVYAGNCNATERDPNINPEAPTRAATNADQGCFVNDVVSNDQINARNVGSGGEYGDIGLLGLVAQGTGGLNTEQVCFLEDTVESNSPLLNTSGNEVLNEHYLYAVTKRLYITRRVKRNDSINEHKSEGINRSYTNHNFYIVARGTGNGAVAKCNEEVTDSGTDSTGLGPQQIVSREISRALNENTANAVTPEMRYSEGTGTANTLIGNVTGSATNLRLFIPEIGTCYPNNNLSISSDATGYICVVANGHVDINGFSRVDIIGSSNQHKDTNNRSVFASCTKTIDGDPGCHWLTNFQSNTFDDGGIISSCTSPWGSDMAENDTVTAYATSNCDEHTGAVILTCTNGALVGSDTTAIYQTPSECSTAASITSCALPWGGLTIDINTTIDAYTEASVAFDGTCPDPIERTCGAGGVLSGDTTAIYQGCTPDAAPCFVPSINGDTTNNVADVADVDLKITGEDLVAEGTINVSLPNKKVYNQYPTAGTPVTCGTTVTYEYK